MAPVVLIEAMRKDKDSQTCVLALALDEVCVVKSDELWEDEDERPAASHRYYDKINASYETLIEKLKNFRTNEVELPLLGGHLATYKSIQHATLVQIRYADIRAVATRQMQKSAQLPLDFSFAAPLWSQCTGGGSFQREPDNPLSRVGGWVGGC